MADESKKKLHRATIVYWILLLYIVAALVWWTISLVKQTEVIYQLRQENLVQLNTEHPVPQFDWQLHQIKDQRKRNIYKYVGEGATFLLLILIGAVFIYRSVRKQFKLQQQQQNFVMAVTHELKTPLAISRLNLETLQKYKLDDAKKDKLLQITLEENVRLDSLINNILISSQLEGNSYQLQKEEINFSDLVKDVAQQFTSRHPDRKLHTRIENEIDCTGDPLLLKLLVSNLLENAQKYSSSKTPVVLNLQKGDRIELSVIDEGPGIADNEKKNIFKKFYRVGNEQTRDAKGTGLGLYLCKKISKDHGGSIIVKNNEPAGSKFIVYLPIT